MNFVCPYYINSMAKTEHRKEYLRNRRAKVCETCGGPKEIGGYCKKCWDKRARRRKELHKEKRQRGECLTCANKVSKSSCCEVCLVKQREQRQRRESTRLEAGLCILCGKESHAHGSRTCGRCFCRGVSKFHFKTYSRTEELIGLLESQHSLCPYTGKKLVLGENCTLDHILPRSRDGANDIDNLQWVFCSEFMNVNILKWNMTDQEFRELIQMVYENIVGENGRKV